MGGSDAWGPPPPEPIPGTRSISSLSAEMSRSKEGKTTVLFCAFNSILSVVCRFGLSADSLCNFKFPRPESCPLFCALEVSSLSLSLGDDKVQHSLHAPSSPQLSLKHKPPTLHSLGAGAELLVAWSWVCVQMSFQFYLRTSWSLLRVLPLQPRRLFSLLSADPSLEGEGMILGGMSSREVHRLPDSAVCTAHEVLVHQGSLYPISVLSDLQHQISVLQFWCITS